MHKMFFAQNVSIVGNTCSLWEITDPCYKYDNISLDTSAYSDSREIRFSIDGTKLYLTSSTSPYKQSIIQYNLSSAWDLSTATYYQSKSLVSHGIYMTGLDFSLDGTMLFVVHRDYSGGVQFSVLYKYIMSTAWDITTATYDSASPILTGNFAWSLNIRNDGYSVYTQVPNDNRVYEHQLTTAYDVTTLVYSGNSLLDSSFLGIYMKDDGTRIYGGYLKQYNLATPFDLSTASLSNTYSETLGGGGLHFKPDGSMFFMGTLYAQAIHQFSYGS